MSNKTRSKLGRTCTSFARKGYEKQWSLQKVMDSYIHNALDELKEILQSSDEKTAEIMDNVHKELEKGQEEIADCQKNIKMADRSEYSWGMVELNEIAEDSLDETLMEMAKKLRKLKRILQRGGIQKGVGSHLPTSKTSQYIRGSLLGNPSNAPAKLWLQEPCWFCSKFGHLAATCPRIKVVSFLTPEVAGGKSCHPTRVTIVIQQVLNVCMNLILQVERRTLFSHGAAL